MATATEDTGQLSVADFKTAPRRRNSERAARLIFLSMAIATFLVSALIIWSVGREAWDFVTRVEVDSLTHIGWFPRRGLYDLSTLVAGTLIVAGIAMAVATPVGLGIAVYLSEYAHPRARKIFKPVVEMLASIPSVVLGFFAISFITPEILQPFFDDISFFNLLAAGIAVGMLTIPIIASISEDAMKAVPMAMREASYGLGSRKVTTATRVVFPAAISGIIASLIVGFSRAVGETMVVAIAAGAVGGGLFTTDPLQPGQTITGAMAALGVGSDQVAGDTLAFQSLYFLGALLFIITFLLNVVGDRLVRRFQERY